LGIAPSLGVPYANAVDLNRRDRVASKWSSGVRRDCPDENGVRCVYSS
jgi:hypothetical protein